jgi:dihydroorotase
MQFDLLLRGGRIIDPSSGVDAVLDIGFSNGRVAALDREIPADRAAKVVDATGRIVTPGLIDLHTHVYWGGTSLGVDADLIASKSGTTTFVDAGSAGPGNILGFRRHVVERSRVRILAYLNISFAGIFGFSSSLMVGECDDLRLCDPREAVPCGREHADFVVGMKVRTGRIAGGRSGIAPLDMAIEAADQLNLPVMAHIDHPPPSRSEVIDRLRPGDVLTHCFRPFPNAPVDGSGHVRSDARAARERGIVFDIGHGMASFDFEVARAMINEGFAPDVISSDIHLFCADGPAFDLLVCMSKLLVLGMPLTQVVGAVTQKPAAAIGRTDLGTLSIGSVGDAAVLNLVSGNFTYTDVVGQSQVGHERVISEGIVIDGKWWPNDAPNAVPDLERFHPRVPETQAAAVIRHFGHAHSKGPH